MENKFHLHSLYFYRRRKYAYKAGFEGNRSHDQDLWIDNMVKNADKQ